MNRRRALGLLGAAGAVLAVTPGALWAETADELAGKAQDFLADGQAAKALPLLLEAQSKDARNDRIQALLGRAYSQQGDARAALRHFSLAVRLNPEDTLSRMMVETISQFPLPGKAGEGREGAASGRVSALAGEARAERQSLLDRGGPPERPGPFRLLIDPGHGGTDPGAPGAGLREADVALDLALRLARILAARREDIAITLSRTGNVTLPLWARAALAGFYGADLVLSLHAARVPDSRAGGVAVYSFARVAGDPMAAAAAMVENAAQGRPAVSFGRGDRELFLTAARQAAAAGRFARAAVLAGTLAAALPATSPLPLRGTGTGPFRLLAEADAPAVLVEAGFLSHGGDAAALASPDKRQALAQALATAVLAAVVVPAATGRGE